MGAKSGGEIQRVHPTPRAVVRGSQSLLLAGDRHEAG